MSLTEPKIQFCLDWLPSEPKILSNLSWGYRHMATILSFYMDVGDLSVANTLPTELSNLPSGPGFFFWVANQFSNRDTKTYYEFECLT